ncbi:MAG: transcriptional repressor [Anaerolineae bacterium]|jgi:Fur family transcriptional regulator, peroxide stress response regulator|nr:transcriptional repressor [Anaerolineae bacterium]MBT7069263.1 transcriptional repressor [Anaerolineae bacterium]MBT7326516.1 transcriptional repressor [Anaerolineae bacterium]
MQPSTEFLTTTLKESGMRMTPQRASICKVLAESDEHPTAAMIYDELRPQFDSLSLATVYNTLDALVKVGVVNSLGKAGDGSVHYDADTEPHVNLACISCNKIVDIPSEHVHHLDEEISATSGYKLLGARVLYYGLCPECQNE